MGRVWRLLRPGGYFVSSTTCLGDTMGLFKLIAPLGQAIGLLPRINVMNSREIDHQWAPGRGKAVFVLARKLEPAGTVQAE